VGGFIGAALLLPTKLGEAVIKFQFDKSVEVLKATYARELEAIKATSARELAKLTNSQVPNNARSSDQKKATHASDCTRLL
jgi:hypothetical protein